MSAHEDFDAILKAVDTLKEDMEETEKNFRNIRINLQEQMDNLNDLGIDFNGIYPILQDLDEACEVEFVNNVKKFYREIS